MPGTTQPRGGPEGTVLGNGSVSCGGWGRGSTDVHICQNSLNLTHFNWCVLLQVHRTSVKLTLKETKNVSKKTQTVSTFITKMFYISLSIMTALPNHP